MHLMWCVSSFSSLHSEERDTFLLPMTILKFQFSGELVEGGRRKPVPLCVCMTWGGYTCRNMYERCQRG